MTVFYKRIPALTLGIAMTCTSVLSSCSKDDDPQPDQNLILQENFDKADNAVWKPGTATNVVKSIQDGWFVVSYTSTGMGTYGFWAPDNMLPADHKTGSVEIVMRHTAGHAYDKAGLIFWLTDSQNYVAFSIGDKDYRIFQMVGGQATNLVNWTASTAIKGKLNEDNKLKVTLTAEKLLFYINDQKVIEMGKGATTTLNKIGFQMSKASTEPQNSTYKIDYVKITRE